MLRPERIGNSPRPRVRHAVAGDGGYFLTFAFSAASLKVLLKVNRGTFVSGLAAIMIVSPVVGLRPGSAGAAQGMGHIDIRSSRTIGWPIVVSA